jgi:uncharacterized protein (DUF4415 family)
MRQKKNSSRATYVDPDDAPPLEQDWFKKADLYRGGKLVRRGRPPSRSSKRVVSLRLSPEVLAYFKATGAGWQTRINETLLRSVKRRAR